MAIATTFTCPNYSGMLYTKSNRATPFLNSIGAAVVSRSVEFPVNQEYSLGNAAQPAITETASLTAPTVSTITRSQAYNVCQIFHEAVGTSYVHASNMGYMSGLNRAGQEPDPQDELDWQIAKAMEKIAANINYTFLNGAYNKAANDGQAMKTRGILKAVSTNAVYAATAHTLSKAILRNLFKAVFDSSGIVDGSVLFMDAASKIALTALYEDSTSAFILPNSRTVGGANISTLVTDFGTVGVVVDRHMPAETILLANVDVCRPVEMIVPNKGNFFYEELAKTGAGVTGQIFGQIGLDYGPEWFHGVLDYSKTSA